MGEAHLNGAYYGPSIPPPSKTYHRPGRGGGCNPFTCCCGCLCSCLFNCICQIILTILFVVGIIVLVFWLIFRPNVVKFHVTDATLTQFNFSTTQPNNLHYNLALNMTIRNPNRRIGVYYDRIEARASYHGERFATQDLTRFYQGRKNTTNLNFEFNGQNVVVLGNGDTSRYNEERSSGRFNIEVKLYLRVRFRVGAFRARFRPEIECDLRVPLESNGVSSGSFETTRCDYDW